MRDTWTFEEAVVGVSVMPRTTGIYRILNVVNGKAYIGSAGSTRRYGGFNARWHMHMSDLRRGRHHSKHLQKAFLKYGPSALLFQILELVASDKCTDREIAWIAYQKTRCRDFGYNMADVCELPVRIIRDASVRLKISNAKTGIPRSPETIRKLKEFAKTKWKPVVMEKEGQLYYADSQREFAERHGLNEGNLGKVMRGSSAYISGFTCPAHVGKFSQGFYANCSYRLRSPDGVIYAGDNLQAFCETQGVRASYLFTVVSKKARQHAGWTLPESPLPEFRLISPSGELLTTKHLFPFSRSHSLDPKNMWALTRGKCKSHKGWRLAPECNSGSEAHLTGKF